MSFLHELQSDFLNDIYDGTFESAKYLLVHEKSGNPQRLQIYHNNTRYILTDALAESYPVLKQLVGEKFFGMMARDYISEHPQPSGNQFTCGKYLNAFLADYTPAKTIPYLADVASLEWTYHECYFAEDVSPMTFKDLSAQIESNEKLKLKLTPSAKIIDVQCNAHEIWEAHQDKNVSEIKLDEKFQTLLLWRDLSNDILIMPLEDKMAEFLKSCEEGKTFLKSMNDLELTEDSQSHFQSEFARLMSSGIFKN